MHSVTFGMAFWEVRFLGYDSGRIVPKMVKLRLYANDAIIRIQYLPLSSSLKVPIHLNFL